MAIMSRQRRRPWADAARLGASPTSTTTRSKRSGTSTVAADGPIDEDRESMVRRPAAPAPRAAAARTGRSRGDWTGSSRRFRFSWAASRCDQKSSRSRGRGFARRSFRIVDSHCDTRRLARRPDRRDRRRAWRSRPPTRGIDAPRSARPARRDRRSPAGRGTAELPVRPGDHDREPAAAVIDQVQAGAAAQAKRHPLRRARNAKNARFSATIAARPRRTATSRRPTGVATARAAASSVSAGQGDARLLVGLDVQVGLDRPGPLDQEHPGHAAAEDVGADHLGRGSTASCGSPGRRAPARSGGRPG